MTDTSRKPVLPLRLPKPTADRIHHLARVRGQSASAFLRDVVTAGLDVLEVEADARELGAVVFTEDDMTSGAGE